ncbi:MAG: hypothetical protein ACRDS0_36585, partial [Pseudonocardiaceae bacterium]
SLACLTSFSTWTWERCRGVEPGGVPDAGVDGDELVAAPELFLPFGGPLAVAGVARLVAHDDPQLGDLLVPRTEVE